MNKDRLVDIMCSNSFRQSFSGAEYLTSQLEATVMEVHTRCKID